MGFGRGWVGRSLLSAPLFETGSTQLAELQHALTGHRNDLPGLCVCAIEDEEISIMLHEDSDNANGVASHLATSHDALLADDSTTRARFALDPAP